MKTDKRQKCHDITIEPIGISIQAVEGNTLLDVIIDNDIPVRSDCGGKRLCGKCQVSVNLAEHLSPPSAAELNHLDAEQVSKGLRLACQESDLMLGVSVASLSLCPLERQTPGVPYPFYWRT